MVRTKVIAAQTCHYLNSSSRKV